MCVRTPNLERHTNKGGARRGGRDTRTGYTSRRYHGRGGRGGGGRAVYTRGLDSRLSSD